MIIVAGNGSGRGAQRVYSLIKFYWRFNSAASSNNRTRKPITFRFVCAVSICVPCHRFSSSSGVVRNGHGNIWMQTTITINKHRKKREKKVRSRVDQRDFQLAVWQNGNLKLFFFLFPSVCSLFSCSASITLIVTSSGSFSPVCLASRAFFSIKVRKSGKKGKKEVSIGFFVLLSVEWFIYQFDGKKQILFG